MSTPDQSRAPFPGGAVRIMGRTVLDALNELKAVLILAVAYIFAAESNMARVAGAHGSRIVSIFDLSDLSSHQAVLFMLYRVAPFMTLSAAVGSAWLIYDHLWRKRDPRPLGDKIVALFTPLTRPAPWVRLVLFCLVFIPFTGTFVAFKAAIPLMQPFAWDTTFAAWDKTLHGGIEPWQITWAVFGAPWATHAIDTLYGTWFMVVFSAPLAVVMFDLDVRRRTRFLVAHMVTWIVLGSGAALAFSSAGPCFFAGVENVAGGFGPLMDNLSRVNETHPLVALKLQALLWNGYQGAGQPIEGISAMPSLHVAHVALLALLAGHFNRPLARLAWGYVAVIVLGSVHLGWHYAIDGYVAIALTALVWLAVGCVLGHRPDAKKAAP